MSRILPRRAALAAPLLTVLLFAAPAAQASPLLMLKACEGKHYHTPGTGKTMAAQVLASDLR